jgi:hypothetical protein
LAGLIRRAGHLARYDGATRHDKDVYRVASAERN